MATMSISNYINDVKFIQNHKDALKHFVVRYSSFNQNPQFDCSLPTCSLAQYGFYFDANKKLIKCIECDFKFEDFAQDSILNIFHKHYKFQPNCSFVQQALEFIAYDKTISIASSDSLMDIDEPFELNLNSKTSFHSAKRAKNVFNNEETRLQTFENIKLKLSPELLAENGFYMVSKDSQANLNKSKSFLTNIQGSNLKDDASNIERIAGLVPASIHIKCAYCTYECLIFKNSLQNTMYKSPIEEHYEKSSKICPIFADSKNIAKFSNLIKFEDKHTNLDWLQCLLDFDNVSSDVQSKKVIDILVNSNDINSQTDDLKVKQIPKVIDQLIINEKSKNSANSLNQGSKDKKGDNVMYVPKAAASSSGPGTSDFSKLQNVLNLSDNVISEKAIHPAYTLYQTRLDSFKEWPATLSQQPADLARAGFYYFGIKDMVKCFFCNGGLKNWDHNDDPYEDHVRWFPKCQFIKQLMGAEFVDYVREKYKNQDSGFTNDQSQSGDFKNMGTSSGTNSRNSSSLNQQNKGKRSVSPRTLNSRLDTNIIRKVVDTIPLITKESIKQSIETQLSTNVTTPSKAFTFGDKNKQTSVTSVYGDDFKTPIEMAKLSIEIEKNKIEKTELSKTISDFIICFLDSTINIENLQNLFMVKYNIFPNNVRILREGAQSRNFALISLNKKDESKCDEIIKDLNLNYKLLNKSNVIYHSNYKIILNFF